MGWLEVFLFPENLIILFKPEVLKWFFIFFII